LRRFSASIDSKMAEFLGVLIGDGCISRFVSRGKVIFEVAFTGNPSEFDYYKGFSKQLVETLFPIKGRLRIRDDNTVRLHFRSKRLALYFLSMGLPLGKKRDASMPLCVRRGHLVASFIGGFYHAEGSIYFRYSKRYPYHARKYGNLLIIQFRCKLRTLMSQLHRGVIELGITPTRIGERDGVYTFRITKQDQISKFLKVVRPRYKTKPRAEVRL
jgi:intein/homing endonuclease